MEENKGVVCRVCLEIVEKFVSVYEVYIKSRICDYINAIADVQIREADGLPDRICSSCFDELEQVVQFKHKCERSHSILTSTPTATLTEPKEESKEDVAVKREDSESEMLYDEPTEDAPEECADTKELEEKAERKSRALDLHLQCDDCKEYFKSKCKLKVHWKRVHLLDALKCLDCKRKFKSYSALIKHKRKETQICKVASQFRIEGEGKERVFYCKECQYSTRNTNHLGNHTFVHNKLRPQSCEICSATFTQYGSLKRHQEYKHPELFEGKPCHVCGKVIIGGDRMHAHLITHSNKREHFCSLCQKWFKRKQCLKNHMLLHNGVKPFVCDTCGKAFYIAAALAAHIRSKHENIRILKCDICGYVTRKNNSLLLHLSKHKIGMLSCGICGKFVDTQEKLLKHQKVHETVKEILPCPHCPREYVDRNHLIKHIKNIHEYKLKGQSGLSIKKNDKLNSKKTS